MPGFKTLRTLNVISCFKVCFQTQLVPLHPGGAEDARGAGERARTAAAGPEAQEGNHAELGVM